jgi:predicted MFS family arabinose efflux permease
VQIGTLYAALLAAGLGGGWLAEHASYKLIFGLTAAFPALIFASSLGLPEPPAEPVPVQAGRTWRGLSGLVTSGGFWACCLLIFLFSFNPFLGTSMFYYQTGALGFSKVCIGTLTSVSGVFGVLGAALFWRVYNRRLRVFGRPLHMGTGMLLRWSIALGAPLTLLYTAYRGPVSAALLTAFFGAAGVFMRLSLMDLVAKMSPEHGEATSFALFMAVFNLAALASNTLGGKLYELWSARPAAAMDGLVLISALCTLACWPLLRWLPCASSAGDAPIPAPQEAA